MFDPEEYFESLEKAISVSNCRSWAQVTGPGPEYPQIELDRFRQWAVIMWRFEVIFPGHGILKAIESHSRTKNRSHLRKISYHFMDENKGLIFRVDSHQTQIPFGDCPHLDPGPRGAPRIEEGDPRLVDNSLKDFDFLRMWDWVLDYISNRRVPWQR